MDGNHEFKSKQFSEDITIFERTVCIIWRLKVLNINKNEVRSLRLLPNTFNHLTLIATMSFVSF